jgi:chorismate mutase/prephenate dehydratase
VTPARGNGPLAELREQVERIDAELVALLARRVVLAREVGVRKREAGLATLDVTREAAVLRRVGTLARDAALPEEAARQIFWGIIGMCRDAQQHAG